MGYSDVKADDLAGLGGDTKDSDVASHLFGLRVGIDEPPVRDLLRDDKDGGRGMDVLEHVGLLGDVDQEVLAEAIDLFRGDMAGALDADAIEVTDIGVGVKRTGGGVEDLTVIVDVDLLG